MNNPLNSALVKKDNIMSSNLTIYDSITMGDSDLWYTPEELTAILNRKLIGQSFEGLPIRTRSRIAKSLICTALGYPIPKSYKKVQPRFPGQLFDIYVQKSNNLQIWNEKIDSKRRYVIIRVNNKDTISAIRVISGTELSLLDTTGTLTQKYQARLIPKVRKNELISIDDTDNIKQLISSDTYNIYPSVNSHVSYVNNVNRNSISNNTNHFDMSHHSPTDLPDLNSLIPIKIIFEKLKPLVGKQFLDIGRDQERNRGAELHRLICEALGYKDYKDTGQFPDIKHQLLEIKLQTSPTIDLGLVCPNSTEPLGIENIAETTIRHCDIRYALFYGINKNGFIKLTNLYVTTGKDFLNRFPQFGGKVINKKLQISLPKNFFNLI